MYCRKCGAKVADDAAFCVTCGAQIGARSVDGAPRQVAQVKQVASQRQQSGPVEVMPPQGKSRVQVIVVAVIAVALVAAGIGFGVWWKNGQDAKRAAQEAWERAHSTHVTQIAVEAPGFDGNATAIPVQVTGTDLDGNHVESLQFIRPDNMAVETLQGSYDLVFPGGYFTGEGAVVKAPDIELHIEVPEGGLSESDEVSAEWQSEGPALFEEVPALEVTDELIGSIRDYVERDPNDGGRASELAQLAGEVRDAAVSAEEERLAAEQAAREALPAGSYSYVAPVGGYRGFITIPGDGTMSLLEASAMRPERFEYRFALEKTGATAPNGNVIYRLVQADGGAYAGSDTIYYDEAQGGVVLSNLVYLGPE